MKMEEYIRGIPSGLLTAQLGEREIQVVGISENGFEFRLEKKGGKAAFDRCCVGTAPGFARCRTAAALHSDTVL